MEVKEAVDLLDNLVGMVEDSHGADYDTALRMGIEALTSKPTDCISRRAALNMKFSNGIPEDGVLYVPYREVKRNLEELPVAQPEPIRINLNEPIKVKLTDWGKEIYYHKYDRTNQIAGREICKPRLPREDENGYTEFQLWCFIELYGTHMGMTFPNVIEPLEIVYER